MKRRLALLLFAVFFLLGMMAAQHADADGQNEAFVKVHPHLIQLHDEYQAHRALGVGAAFAHANALARVVNDSVLIDAVAADDASLLESRLVALGMRNAVAHGRVVSGYFPIAALTALESLSALRFVQPSYFTTRSGTTTSQGDLSMRSDIARANLGVNGAGGHGRCAVR